MKTSLVSILALLTATACASRVHVVTGTTVGLKVNSGEADNGAPTVVFGYKRAELAVIPTMEGGTGTPTSDAFSALATFDLETNWFSETAISQVIATGFAAQTLTKPPKDPKSASADASDTFASEFADASIGVESERTVQRRRDLIDATRRMPAGEPDEVIRALGITPAPGLSASETLRDVIGRARGRQLLELEQPILARAPAKQE